MVCPMETADFANETLAWILKHREDIDDDGQDIDLDDPEDPDGTDGADGAEGGFFFYSTEYIMTISIV